MFPGLMSRCRMPCSCGVMHRACDLRDQFHRAANRHRLVPGHFVELSAFDELHAEVARAVALADFVDRNDAGMLQKGGGFGFKAKTLQVRFARPLPRLITFRRLCGLGFSAGREIPRPDRRDRPLPAVRNRLTLRAASQRARCFCRRDAAQHRVEPAHRCPRGRGLATPATDATGKLPSAIFSTHLGQSPSGASEKILAPHFRQTLITVFTAAFPRRVFWKPGYYHEHRLASCPSARGRRRFFRSTDRRAANPRTASVSVRHS